MIEIVSKLFERTKIYGEKRAFFYITVFVVVFFKPLVINWYNPIIHFPFRSLLWIFLVAFIVIKFRHQLEMNESKFQIAFLFAGCSVGKVNFWLGHIFYPVPDISGYVEMISSTSRLSWIVIMFQWEKVMPSLYFILYFVSGIYLAWRFVCAPFYWTDLNNPLFDKRALEIKFWYAILTIILLKSNMAYCIMSYLFSLLE